MKKFILILGLILSLASNVRADVCYDVDEKVLMKAAKIVGEQTEIYQYCSICREETPKIIKIDNVKADKRLYVNGQPQDLAHVYYKENDKFINLGIASGCIKNNDYNIQSELKELPTIHRSYDKDKKQAEQEAQKIFNKCNEASPNANPVTTVDMVEYNIDLNGCIATAIEKEITKGFEPEKQNEMIDYMQQARKNIWKFYFGIYAQNKYCSGTCGTMTNLLPYADEGDLLMNMLEKILYLNIAKNGY